MLDWSGQNTKIIVRGVVLAPDVSSKCVKRQCKGDYTHQILTSDDGSVHRCVALFFFNTDHCTIITIVQLQITYATYLCEIPL